ncbi:MAG: IS21 family transposase [Acidimicrobiia bacterium]|nr:IS21 family transposase [Acidimicrobiia bacterium]
MRKIREVLRLRAAGRSQYQIARSVGIGQSTVGDYLTRARRAGIGWPTSLDDVALERALYPPKPALPDADRGTPDWAVVHAELKRKGVTLFLLWEEYKSAHPDGFQYSWFCQHYRAFAGKVDLVMRQSHRAGEALFVDYAGQTVPVVDRATGEVRQAEIFVAVLGASNYTFAEATWTQTLEDWIGSHQRALHFIGGVPEMLVPDNLKSGVTKTHRYEPDLNPTYSEMAAHYGVAIVPTRVAKPKDKSKVEVGVQVVERWILARLRNETFFSLAEVNRAIAELLPMLNDRPFKKLPGSRRELFETLDHPALGPLPAKPYPFATWKKVRVNIDYHVEIERHYYSVPYQLVKMQLDARVTAHTVELLHRGKRVASHPRSRQKAAHTTIPEHMPRPHREYAEWTPRRLVEWANKAGPATAQLVSTILASRRHPQQGFRSCLGILRLGKTYTETRLEAACHRALRLGAHSYKSIESILKHKLDQQPLPEPAQKTLSIDHDNLRDPDYFH